LLIFP